MTAIVDQDCLLALGKWAKRVISEGGHNGPEERRCTRQRNNAEMILMPLDSETLLPRTDRSTAAVGKDVSERGMGVVCNVPLKDNWYFAQMTDGEILLVRRIRGRRVLGAVSEYGFMILDRYGSFAELQGDPIVP